jgi:hypothetical protein
MRSQSGIKSFVDSGGRGPQDAFVPTTSGQISGAVVAVGHTFQLVFDAVEAVVFALAAAVTKLVSVIAHVTDALTTPQRKILEFFGLAEKGNDTLGKFADGAGTVADIFRDHFASAACTTRPMPWARSATRHPMPVHQDGGRVGCGC